MTNSDSFTVLSHTFLTSIEDILIDFFSHLYPTEVMEEINFIFHINTKLFFTETETVVTQDADTAGHHPQQGYVIGHSLLLHCVLSIFLMEKNQNETFENENYKLKFVKFVSFFYDFISKKLRSLVVIVSMKTMERIINHHIASIASPANNNNNKKIKQNLFYQNKIYLKLNLTKSAQASQFLLPLFLRLRIITMFQMAGYYHYIHNHLTLYNHWIEFISLTQQENSQHLPIRLPDTKRNQLLPQPITRGSIIKFHFFYYMYTLLVYVEHLHNHENDPHLIRFDDDSKGDHDSNILPNRSVVMSMTEEEFSSYSHSILRDEQSTDHNNDPSYLFDLIVLHQQSYTMNRLVYRHSLFQLMNHILFDHLNYITETIMSIHPSYPYDAIEHVYSRLFERHFYYGIETIRSLSHNSEYLKAIQCCESLVTSVGDKINHIQQQLYSLQKKQPMPLTMKSYHDRTTTMTEELTRTKELLLRPDNKNNQLQLRQYYVIWLSHIPTDMIQKGLGMKLNHPIIPVLQYEDIEQLGLGFHSGSSLTRDYDELMKDDHIQREKQSILNQYDEYEGLLMMIHIDSSAYHHTVSMDHNRPFHPSLSYHALIQQVECYCDILGRLLLLICSLV
jgi:hypothetical protein